MMITVMAVSFLGTPRRRMVSLDAGENLYRVGEDGKHRLQGLYDPFRAAWKIHDQRFPPERLRRRD